MLGDPENGYIEITQFLDLPSVSRPPYNALSPRNVPIEFFQFLIQILFSLLCGEIGI